VTPRDEFTDRQYRGLAVLVALSAAQLLDRLDDTDVLTVPDVLPAAA
jgi:hypothetical protein